MVMYLANLTDRVMLFSRGVGSAPEIAVTDDEARAIADDDLPLYTVFVPAFDEPEVVTRLIHSLGALDYPDDKLDIQLLLEADDDKTVSLAYEGLRSGCCGPTSSWCLRPSPGQAQACNYGLQFARGEFATIYDAEDLPEPLQLRRAVRRLRRLPQRVVCIQAKLSYRKTEQNLLTRWFTSSTRCGSGYSCPGWTDGLAHPARRHLEPLPHRRACGARRLGPVQRDRGRRPGHPAGPARLPHCGSSTRSPWKRRTATDQLVASALALVQGLPADLPGPHPPTPAGDGRSSAPEASYAFAASPPGHRSFLGSQYLLLGADAGLGAGRARLHPGPLPSLAFLSGHVVPVRSGTPPLIYCGLGSGRDGPESPACLGACLLVPTYWVLMSVAAVKAFVQLVFQPSYWEKTVHGLDSRTDLTTELAGSGMVP